MMTRAKLLALAATLASMLVLSSAGTAMEPSEGRGLAALPAPSLTSPLEGAVLTTFGPTLTWTNPPSTTQVHLQVIPYNNDGPGADIYLGSPVTSFELPPPPQWYGLLPDMSYTWGVRVSDATTSVAVNDPSWSTWAERRFRTPVLPGSAFFLVSPPNGSSIITLTPTLQWSSSRPEAFYYEVQVSKDRNFGASAFLYGELRHGGITDPPNSYTVPVGFPLENNTIYYWRVRPRVQGDGKPMDWSTLQVFSLTTLASGASQTPTAAATSVPTQTSTPTPTATGLATPTVTSTLTPTPTPTPTGTPKPVGSYRIAFTSQRDGNTEIYVMNADGSGLKNLTNHPASEFLFRWSPDGTKIAFVGDRTGNNSEIYVMNADGTGVKPITTYGGLGFAWSPDGMKMAGTGSELYDQLHFKDVVYVVNADGSGRKNLTNSLGGSHHFGGWSPDSTRITFSSTGPDGRGVYVVNADGSGLKNITTSPGGFHPIWAPVSDRIAFGSNRDGNTGIYVVNADGSGVKKVADHAWSMAELDWSPDGTRIAFTFYHEGENKREIYVANADGSGVKSISNLPYLSGYPSWSPDGTRIAFIHSLGGDLRLYVVNADGSNPKNLFNYNPGSDAEVVWSPDSTRIALAVYMGEGKRDIFVVNSDGSGVKNLTNHPSNNRSPAWSPK